MAEGARFENGPGPETIGRDPLSSVQSQPLTEQSEAGEEGVDVESQEPEAPEAPVPTEDEEE